MNKMRWCETYLWLDRKPIQYPDRPYLSAIYAVESDDLVLRCSRQTEKSTTLMATIVYLLCRFPGIKILFVSPREDQSRVFCRMRLFPTLEQSPLVRKNLLGNSRNPSRMGNITFANGSQLYVRASFRTADAARGISADVLIVDEYQDLAQDSLPVLQETMSHSPRRQTILVGTPKLISNHLETVYQQSTACEWTLRCEGCQRNVILDESAIGPTSVACPECRQALDPLQGSWHARHPDAAMQGFWINHLMVPWVNHDEILDRQRTYDLSLFKNEVLGLPTTLGEHVVTRNELEACCTGGPMLPHAGGTPRANRSQLIAGIDWGGGGTAATVIVLGYMDSNFVFHALRFDRFQPDEDPQLLVARLAERCRSFGVRLIAADGGGNGHVFNRLLQAELNRYDLYYAILYSASTSEPRQDGTLWKWSVDRSATLGALFSRVRKQLIRFPRAEDCSRFLDEIACEVAVHDDHQRKVIFTHPDNMNDDTLHALNYALLLGTRVYQHQHSYSF